MASLLHFCWTSLCKASGDWLHSSLLRPRFLSGSKTDQLNRLYTWARQPWGLNPLHWTLQSSLKTQPLTITKHHYFLKSSAQLLSNSSSALPSHSKKGSYCWSSLEHSTCNSGTSTVLHLMKHPFTSPRLSASFCCIFLCCYCLSFSRSLGSVQPWSNRLENCISVDYSWKYSLFPMKMPLCCNNHSEKKNDSEKSRRKLRQRFNQWKRKGIVREKVSTGKKWLLSLSVLFYPNRLAISVVEKGLLLNIQQLLDIS